MRRCLPEPGRRVGNLEADRDRSWKERPGNLGARWVKPRASWIAETHGQCPSLPLISCHLRIRPSIKGFSDAP